MAETSFKETTILVIFLNIGVMMVITFILAVPISIPIWCVIEQPWMVDLGVLGMFSWVTVYPATSRPSRKLLNYLTRRLLRMQGVWLE